MPYVASKALFAPYFPLINWEFYGATSLVEVLGFVVITSPGDYSIAAISQDKFLVWLNDKWLVMKGVDHGGSVGLRSSAWTADVQFEVAGGQAVVDNDCCSWFLCFVTLMYVSVSLSVQL